MLHLSLGDRATRIWNCYCDFENGHLIDDPYLFNKRINDLSDVAAQIVRGSQNVKLSSSATTSQVNPVFPSSMSGLKRSKEQACCFNYNLPEARCSFGAVCNYGHHCFACGKNHPIYSCRQANASQLLGEVRKRLQKILEKKRRSNRARF